MSSIVSRSTLLPQNGSLHPCTARGIKWWRPAPHAEHYALNTHRLGLNPSQNHHQPTPRQTPRASSSSLNPNEMNAKREHELVHGWERSRDGVFVCVVLHFLSRHSVLCALLFGLLSSTAQKSSSFASFAPFCSQITPQSTMSSAQWEMNHDWPVHQLKFPFFSINTFIKKKIHTASYHLFANKRYPGCRTMVAFRTAACSSSAWTHRMDTIRLFRTKQTNKQQQTKTKPY